MKKFEDLVFEKHSIAKSSEKSIEKYPGYKDLYEDSINAKQAVIEFDNGVKLSVIFGEIFYSDGISTYEAMELDYDNEPRGYLTRDEVSEYMEELQKKDKK